MSSTASKRSILGQLHLAATAIANAQANPLIAAALLPYGYTPERFSTGQSLLDNALECFRQQQHHARRRHRRDQCALQSLKRKPAIDNSKHKRADGPHPSHS